MSRGTTVAVQLESQPWTTVTAISHTEEIRSYFAHIIRASSEDIAIVPSTGTGFAMTTMIAQHNILKEMQVKLKWQSFSFSSSSKKKVKVLLLQDEMSSEVYAWQEITQELEIEFIIVDIRANS